MSHGSATGLVWVVMRCSTVVLGLWGPSTGSESEAVGSPPLRQMLHNCAAVECQRRGSGRPLIARNLLRPTMKIQPAKGIKGLSIVGSVPRTWGRRPTYKRRAVPNATPLSNESALQAREPKNITEEYHNDGNRKLKKISQRSIAYYQPLSISTH